MTLRPVLLSTDFGSVIPSWFPVTTKFTSLCKKLSTFYNRKNIYIYTSLFTEDQLFYHNQQFNKKIRKQSSSSHQLTPPRRLIASKSKTVQRFFTWSRQKIFPSNFFCPEHSLPRRPYFSGYCFCCCMVIVLYVYHQTPGSYIHIGEKNNTQCNSE